MKQDNQNSKAYWLEALILFVINAEENGDYVYSITCKLGEKMNVSESTVYPICKRMKAKEWLSTYDINWEGRIRKYYKVTESGKAALEQYQKEWIIYRELISDWLCK